MRPTFLTHLSLPIMSNLPNNNRIYTLTASQKRNHAQTKMLFKCFCIFLKLHSVAVVEPFLYLGLVIAQIKRNGIHFVKMEYA
jgi:hypothetical protein